MIVEIPIELWNELLHALWEEKDRAIKAMKSNKEGTNLWAYDKGRIVGLMYAITLISSWNQPNHGKVVARPS
jgi:hypothetical protein